MDDLDEVSDMESDAHGFQPMALSYRPNFREILICILNVGESEVRTYEILLRKQSADVNTLAEEIDRSVNTVREQLSSLQDKWLVTRDTRVTKQGRHYTYEPVSPVESKQMLLETIKPWTVYVSNRIEHLTDNSVGDPMQFRHSTTASNSSANVPQQLLHGEHPSLHTIATYVFGMKGPVLKQYLVLLDHPGSTARELAQVQGLARSTVSGRLNALQKQGLACPVGREIETGARMAYEYTPRPWNEVKTEMKGQVNDDWSEHVEQTIGEFYQMYAE